MPSKRDPIACLDDMIENIERIQGYLSGLDRVAFASNGMVRDAVERCLERVCEATHRLGGLGPELMPDQPWGDIRGMGNWLRHALRPSGPGRDLECSLSRPARIGCRRKGNFDPTPRRSECAEVNSIP